MRYILAILLAASCATAYEPGDVNHDGVINSTDVQLVLQYVVGAIDSTALDLALADISGNGEVTAYDAALIQQVVDSGVTKVGSQSVYVPLAAIKGIFR